MGKGKRSFIIIVIALLITSMITPSIALAKDKGTKKHIQKGKQPTTDQSDDEGLSELLPLTTKDWISATSVEDKVHKNANIYNESITLYGENDEIVTHETGIGIKSNSTIIYDLTSDNFDGYSGLETFVGIDTDQTHEHASVKFQIFIDGEMKAESAIMKSGMKQEKLEVSLKEAEELKLVTVSQGEETSYDDVNWGSPMLIAHAKNEAEDLKPRLMVGDHIYAFGDIVDLEKLVKATNTSGEDITSQVVIDTNYIEGSYGTFEVTYTVTEGKETISTSIEIFVPEPVEQFTEGELDDIEELLEANASIYNSLKEIGFTDEHIKTLADLPRREDSFYINDASPNTVKATNNVNDEVAANNLEDPPSSSEITDRMSKITRLVNTQSVGPIGSESYNSELMYLYLSHYVDNPYYPNFSKAYCHIILPEDREVYESYIQVGTAKKNTYELLKTVLSAGSFIKSSPERLEQARQARDNSTEAIFAIRDNWKANKELGDIKKGSKEIIDAFERNYETAPNLESLIEMVHADLPDADYNFGAEILNLYSELLVLVPLATTSSSLIMVGSDSYLEFVKSASDKFAYDAMRYSTSLRITLRQYSTWW